MMLGGVENGNYEGDCFLKIQKSEKNKFPFINEIIYENSMQ